MKNRSTIKFSNLGIYLEKNKNSNLKRYDVAINVQGSVIYNSHDMEPVLSVHWQMDKEIQPQKKEILPICNHEDTKWNKSGWKLMIWSLLFVDPPQTQTYSQRTDCVPEQKVGWEGRNGEGEINGTNIIILFEHHWP